MAGQWGGGPQHTPSAAHLSAGCPPPQIFDREKDGTPANEGPDPLHLSAVLRPPASHPHSRFQSLPGWTGQAFPVGGGRGSSRNSAPGTLECRVSPASLPQSPIYTSATAPGTREKRVCQARTKLRPGPSGRGNLSQPWPPDQAGGSLTPRKDSTASLSPSWLPISQP